MEYIIYLEKDLESYKDLTKNQLLELYRENDDEKARIVLAKRNHNLKGDIYYVNGFIANAKNHKAMFPDSTATTIEDMAKEYIASIETNKED